MIVLMLQEQEKAAVVFEEFLASFEPNQKSGVKTFVRGGIVNPTKGQLLRLAALHLKSLRVLNTIQSAS